jgi:hypothetical protein
MIMYKKNKNKKLINYYFFEKIESIGVDLINVHFRSTLMILYNKIIIII